MNNPQPFTADSKLPTKIWAYATNRGWECYSRCGGSLDMGADDRAAMPSNQWLKLGYSHWAPYEQITTLPKPPALVVEKTTAELAAQIKKLEAKCSEKDQIIQDSGSSIKYWRDLAEDRGHSNTVLSEAIEGKDKLISIQASELKKLRELLAKAEDEVVYFQDKASKNLDTALEPLGKIIKDKDTQIHKLVSQKSEMCATITKLESEITKLGSETVRLRGEIGTLRSNIKTALTSSAIL